MNCSKNNQTKSLSVYLCYFPYVLCGYFLLHFIVRIFISPNLEVDEAQFVGSTDFQLLYNNSHPPLYNWLVRVMLELTGWSWSIALPLLKNILLLGMYLLAFDLIYRISKSHVSAVTVVLTFLLLPQIVWQSQVTLAHSVLVAFACVALLHSLVLVVQKGRWKDYIWLGLATVIGIFAKFHFLIFCVAIILVFASNSDMRKHFSWKKTSLSFSIIFLLTLPIFLSVIFNLSQSTARMKKLYRESVFSSFDLPYVGVDGVLSFFGAFFAWCGPLLVFYLVMQLLKRISIESPIYPDAETNFFVKLFGLTSVIASLIFITAVFFADMHFVHERYLTPVLMAFPFWFVLRFPFSNEVAVSSGLIRLVSIIMIGVLIGSSAMVMFGKHSLSYPYDEFAKGLEEKFGTGIHILAARDRDYGNLVKNISGAMVVHTSDTPKHLVLVWRKHREKVPNHLIEALGKSYKPSTEVFSQEGSYYYFSGYKAKLFGLKFTRLDP